MWLLLVPYSLGLTSTFISISSFAKSSFLQDEELRTYFAIVAISTGLIILNILESTTIWLTLSNTHFSKCQLSNHNNRFWSDRYYQMATLSQYPTPPDVYRRSAGSTAGGFKVIRAMIIAKIARNQTWLASILIILSLHINGSVLDKETQRQCSQIPSCICTHYTKFSHCFVTG